MNRAQGADEPQSSRKCGERRTAHDSGCAVVQNTALLFRASTFMAINPLSFTKGMATIMLFCGIGTAPSIFIRNMGGCHMDSGRKRPHGQTTRTCVISPLVSSQKGMKQLVDRNEIYAKIKAILTSSKQYPNLVADNSEWKPLLLPSVFELEAQKAADAQVQIVEAEWPPQCKRCQKRIRSIHQNSGSDFDV